MFASSYLPIAKNDRLDIDMRRMFGFVFPSRDFFSHSHVSFLVQANTECANCGYAAHHGDNIYILC